ncbi:hypothetical protein [Thiosulfativibrio zosterae]|uniref:Uncharacterized protein n=1 Tax=Thiosulfativibrio zosterae TaxID=2675053 RepID=A0A6F8PNT7_9GAMM|nr:hypothetical protein [Thiosulfativibrio zosterae]BBP43782.1 hypothetical protein THMIRHAT_15280 [Thiosulfativibrio zosterae]
MKIDFFKSVLWVCLTFLTLNATAWAKDFLPGETVMVAYPANNIKDDAYIIGLVRQQVKNGDYQISVLDYVKGHDYGISCVPIRENELGQATNEVVWEMWTDRTQLFGKGMQYIVPQANVRKLQTGQFDFIERNNLYITFSRWKSNAPIMTLDQFDIAMAKAKSLGLSELVPALVLAKKERESYYEPGIGRPYWPYEAVPKLNDLMADVITTLKSDKQLNQLWRQKSRDWKNKTISTQHYFLIEALDKILFDASYESAEDDLDKVDPAVLKQFRERLRILGAKV